MRSCNDDGGLVCVPWAASVYEAYLLMLQKWTRQKCVACHTTDIYFDGLLLKENKQKCFHHNAIAICDDIPMLWYDHQVNFKIWCSRLNRFANDRKFEKATFQRKRFLDKSCVHLNGFFFWILFFSIISWIFLWGDFVPFLVRKNPDHD